MRSVQELSEVAAFSFLLATSFSLNRALCMATLPFIINFLSFSVLFFLGYSHQLFYKPWQIPTSKFAQTTSDQNLMMSDWFSL